jgi:hypothetical protein
MYSLDKGDVVGDDLRRLVGMPASLPRGPSIYTHPPAAPPLQPPLPPLTPFFRGSLAFDVVFIPYQRLRSDTSDARDCLF